LGIRLLPHFVRGWIYGIIYWIMERDDTFPDMPAVEVAWMCAAPVEMLAAGGERADGDALAAWAEGLAGRRGGVRGRGCLRFAFYGRVSTEDWQDPESSRARQLQQAIMLVAGTG
jgi:hypothetical protein